jgi:indole-3-glycerol phosphate synthase
VNDKPGDSVTKGHAHVRGVADSTPRGSGGPERAVAAPDSSTDAVAADSCRSSAVAGVQTYLDRIVPAVLQRLEERKRRLPPAELVMMTWPEPRPSFAAALRAPGVSLIAEVKRASPSKGPLRPDLEVGPLVKAYEAAGARAVSVLTEQDHFRGSLDDLHAAAANTALPLLRKDFVVDPYQVHEARAFGASAVLLIAALLSDEQLAGLAGLAKDLGLDVLLEVHDEAEMGRALWVEGTIIGVNNRDLRTFDVSLETTVRLAGMVPGDRLLVGESGIRGHDDVERLASCGVDAVLVGESILSGGDAGVAAAALMVPVPPVAARPIGWVRKKEAR